MRLGEGIVETKDRFFVRRQITEPEAVYEADMAWRHLAHFDPADPAPAHQNFRRRANDSLDALVHLLPTAADLHVAWDLAQSLGYAPRTLVGLWLGFAIPLAWSRRERLAKVACGQ